MSARERGSANACENWQFPLARARGSWERMVTMYRKLWSMLLTACFVLLAAGGVSAREIHVAKAGEDGNPGDRARPYRTISKAAGVAQAGDTVTVHAGTYREWVRPAQGGTSEPKRITYRAATGEQVLIKGSERITSWKPEGGGSGRRSCRTTSSAGTTRTP